MGAASSTESPVGRVLDGRYRIVAELGSGGVGVVYRAEHVQLGRPVAVKLLHPEIGLSQNQIRRFDRESRLLASLSHPHIVTVTDYGVGDGSPYLVMELLEGQTLQELIKAEGALPPERALRITHQILRALAYAHGEGFVHRDLKPGNVFLQSLPDAPDHVRILDFGLAKMVGGDGSEQDAVITRTGAVFGTPAYMAPEQASGDAVDASTDVYAAGVVLFEMLAGQRPFLGNLGELMKQHLLSPVPQLHEVNPAKVASPELDRFLRKAMGKRRDERFSDAGEMLEALEALPRPVLHEVKGKGKAKAKAKSRKKASRKAAPKSTVRKAAPTRKASRKSGAAFGEAATVAAAAVSPIAAHTPTQPAADSEAATRAQRPAARPAPRRRPGSNLRIWKSLAGFILMLGVVGAAGYGLYKLVKTTTHVVESGADSVKHGADSVMNAAPDVSSVKKSVENLGSKAKKMFDSKSVQKLMPGKLIDDSKKMLDEPSQGGHWSRTSGPGTTATAPTTTAQSADTNPWSAPIPSTLQRFRRQLARGRAPRESADKVLRSFARSHPSDPRPLLLLGHTFMLRGWRTDAVKEYELAQERTSSARGDPQMLDDLITIASEPPPDVSYRARRALSRIYGSRAIPSVRARLSRSDLSSDARDRLERLMSALGG